jgi:molybdenum cofactor biosynthesis enzyme MoaA
MFLNTQSQSCVFCHATKSKSYHVASMANTRFCHGCAGTLGLTREKSTEYCLIWQNYGALKRHFDALTGKNLTDGEFKTELLKVNITPLWQH